MSVSTPHPASAPPESRRVVTLTLALVVAALMAGCASAPKESPLEDLQRSSWTGRLGLTVASEPPQSFSAGFSLRGDEQSGELSLTSPLGSTLAAMQWQPGTAVLRQGEQEQRYNSLDDLVAHATGTPLPVRALFSWLRGQQQDIDGWHADLSGLNNGRLFAQRRQPLPTVDLRMVLDR